MQIGELVGNALIDQERTALGSIEQSLYQVGRGPRSAHFEFVAGDRALTERHTAGPAQRAKSMVQAQLCAVAEDKADEACRGSGGKSCQVGFADGGVREDDQVKLVPHLLFQLSIAREMFEQCR